MILCKIRVLKLTPSVMIFRAQGQQNIIPQISHVGILMISICRHLENSKHKERLFLNPHNCLKTDHPKGIALCACAQLLQSFWLFVTLQTIAHQVPLSRGILQARIVLGVAISSSRGSSQPKDRTQIFYVSCTGRQILYHCSTWEVPSLPRPSTRRLNVNTTYGQILQQTITPPSILERA